MCFVNLSHKRLARNPLSSSFFKLTSTSAIVMRKSKPSTIWSYLGEDYMNTVKDRDEC